MSKFNLTALLILSCTLIFSASTFANQYGDELTLEQSITIEQAVIATNSGNEDTLLIEGTVTSVCQVKGCWMGFANETGDVRVTFKDYEFFVPFSIVGKTALVEGTLEKVTLSLKDSKHIVQDGGGDPDSVTEPLVEYQMVATGVKVKS